MWVEYVARRDRLAPGHIVNSTYRIILSAQDIAIRRVVTSEIAEAISGYTETVLHNAKYHFDVTLDRCSGSMLLLVEEFLTSTEAGEQFTIDIHGSPDDPVRPVIAVRTDKGHTLDRRTRKGRGGYDDEFSATFSAREL